MIVHVGSYFELYSTLMGWMAYGLIWDVLSLSGIVFLPFGWIIFRNWMSASTNSNDRPAAGLSLKKNLWEIVIAIVIMLFAAVPVYLVRPAQVVFTPPPSFTDPDPVEASAADDPSTYAETFGTVTATGGARIPLWWALIYRISSGITAAVAQNLPSTGDLRAARTQLAQVQLSDTGLAGELSGFVAMCFTPARAKLARMVRESGMPLSAREAIEEYGERDTEWVGSHAFLETEGLYRPCPDHRVDECHDSLRATRPVSGWPYRGDRDVEYTQSDIDVGLPGMPYCDEWWLGADGNAGLKTRLSLESGDKPLFTGLNNFFSGRGWDAWSDEEIEDAQIRNLMHSSTLGSPIDYSYAGRSTLGESWLNDVKNVPGFFGSLAESAAFNAKLHVIIQALPYIKALLLLGIVILLPFLLVMSLYSLDGLYTASVIVFSMFFLDALWAIARWVDNYAAMALFPSLAEMAWDYLTLAQGLDETVVKRMILDMLAGTMYIGLPIMWFMMLGWVGTSLGRTSQVMNEFSRQPGQAGGRAGKMATGRNPR